MGIFGILPILAMNASINLMSTSATSRHICTKPDTDNKPNKYGEEHREIIIRNVIRRAMPLWLIGWFDVCPVNDAADILNPQWPVNDAYEVLSSYHCVNFYSIPRAIRKRLPSLIREALTPPQESK